MSRYRKLDRYQIRLWPNSARESKVLLGDIINPYTWHSENPVKVVCREVQGLAQAIRDARERGRPVIWFIAGHVIKHGLSKFVIDLMDRGYITHLAGNGSVAVHDIELAYTGHTSEDVGKYIKDGRFGHWRTAGMINKHVDKEFDGKLTIGEILGNRMKVTGRGRNFSVIRAAWDREIPCTFHLLVGGDINHQHASCTPRLFAASYEDFLVFAGSIQSLSGGVFLNVGSQVTGTEVFLKALSMARNVAVMQGSSPIQDITTAMADFVRLPEDWRSGEASEGSAAYYYRPWKTILLRAIADGGQSFYLGGPHACTIPDLWKTLCYP